MRCKLDSGISRIGPMNHLSSNCMIFFILDHTNVILSPLFFNHLNSISLVHSFFVDVFLPVLFHFCFRLVGNRNFISTLYTN